jgi:hypothetical protein
MEVVLSSEIKVSSSQISVFSSDYDISSSQGDVGSSKDGADSSVGDVYSGTVKSGIIVWSINIVISTLAFSTGHKIRNIRDLKKLQKQYTD